MEFFGKVVLASSLLISCFLLYSGVSGAPAGWVAAILIFGNVGQTFMQLALWISEQRPIGIR
ncbi:hypothetical protein PCURB6_16050 [Paenibacillus curdlanolyticus]|nr:hypothetical protein PCURB6_16050 [Paenibacillus curdlanolyticus]